MKSKGSITQLHTSLKNKGLKVTPQRVSILNAIHSLGNHPTAEMIKSFVHQKNPAISTATVYKTLETFVQKGILRKIRTSDEEAARYDAILTDHHHLHSSQDHRMVDYENEELDNLLREFFHDHRIPDFKIESIRLEIHGTFENHQ